MNYKHLIVASFFLATPAFAADAPMPRLITVTGYAKQEVAPDQAILSGQIVSKAKKLADAKKENDEMAEKVLKIVTGFEIPKHKVAASNVYINPEYRYDQKTNKQILEGYNVSRNLTITMDRLDIHERVLSALVEAGIDQIGSVSFTIAEPEARADALRVKAVQNARTRAEALAKAAGARLGRVMSIATDGASSLMPPPMPMRYAKMGMAESADMASAPSLPGMNVMSESVTVSFELE